MRNPLEDTEGIQGSEQLRLASVKDLGLGWRGGEQCGE